MNYEERRKHWLEHWREEWIAMDYDPETCTCLNCDWQTNDCPCKFDLYNTDGDCLMEK